MEQTTTMTDDEVVALYREIQPRALEVLTRRHREEMTAARGAGRLYLADFYSYHQLHTEEFLTADEALVFLWGGFDNGNLSPLRVTGPDGYLLEAEALSEALDALDAR